MSDRLTQLHQMHLADPADPDLPYMIALELAKGEHPEDALNWLDKCIALNPDYHYAYYQKGQLLAQLGRKPEARAAIQQGTARAAAANNAKALNELQELLSTVSEA